MEIYKDEEGVFKFNGVYKYINMNTKSIEVDGVIYYNNNPVEECISVNELRSEYERYFTTYNFDFNEINYSVSIEDYTFNSLAKVPPCIKYSENDEVNLIIRLFDEGFLDSRIHKLYTTKLSDYYPIYYNDEWENILKTLRVRIPLFSYGFNNTVCYEISIQTLFEMDESKIPNSLYKLFRHFEIDLKAKDKFKEVLKLTSKIISNYETSK